MVVPLRDGVRRRLKGHPKPKVTSEKFSAGDYFNLYNHFADCKWSSIFRCTYVDKQFSELTHILREGMHQFTLLRKAAGFMFPLCFATELRRLINKKRHAHRKKNTITYLDEIKI